MVVNARFMIGDYPLFISEAVPQSNARFMIGDYPLFVSEAVPQSNARFMIGDYPVGTDTPEKLHIWNADAQQWVHEPRYVWDDTNQVWISVS